MRKMILAAALVCGICCSRPAFAEEVIAIKQADFSMDRGACLRGPLRFEDANGDVILSLSAGDDYPVGCSR